MNKQIGDCISILKDTYLKKPLIHNITNYVTANDCANAILSIGASPIMSDDLKEVEEIVSISKALVLNIGTLNQRTIDSMLIAGKRANVLNIPVILDPVGVGSSKLRNETIFDILFNVKINVLRGNLSEIAFIAGKDASSKGVDTALMHGDYNTKAIAFNVAEKFSCIVGITGKEDIVTDGKKAIKIRNGNQLLSRVTGTGCMTTALVGSLCGATNDYYSATIAGISCMGIAGELAHKEVGEESMGSFHIELFNSLSQISEKCFKERVKIFET